MKASNASHLPPQYKQLPVWRAAVEISGKKAKKKSGLLYIITV